MYDYRGHNLLMAMGWVRVGLILVVSENISC